jgi:hypothetical protein
MKDEEKKDQGEMSGMSDEPPKAAAAEPAAGNGKGAAPAKDLTPDEQMALYEDDLKENDWGHQPC